MKNNSPLNQLSITKNAHPCVVSNENDEFEELKNNQTLLIDRGYDHIERGEYYQAFTVFSIGTTINSTDPEILKGLGISLFEMGKLNKSKIILERAARLRPDDPITLANLAGVYWEMGDFELAIHNYHKSLEIDSEIEETYFNLINLYIDSGHLYMAFIACNKFMALYPDNDDVNELMGEIMLNLALSSY